MTILYKSVKEAAKVLNIMPARVRELIRDGALEAIQNEVSFRWSVSSVAITKYLRMPRPQGRPLKAFQKKKRGRK